MNKDKKGIRSFLTILGFLMFSVTLVAQKTGKPFHHALTVSSGFVQYKDEYNYGLVNSGPNLGTSYTLSTSSDKRILSYEAALDLGLNFGKGTGMAISFKPFEFFYGFGLPANASHALFVGPFLAGYYMWQLYPELQAGYMFWMSSYEVGPEVLYSRPLRNSILHFALGGSLAGFYSRPGRQAEEYYYSLRLADFDSNPDIIMNLRPIESFQVSGVACTPST